MNASSTTRRDLLAASLAGLAASSLPHSALAEKRRKPKVLFFTKSSGFEHGQIRRTSAKLGPAEIVLIELGKKLGIHGFDVEATKDGRIFDGNLGQYDGFVFYTTGDLTKAGNDKQPPMTPKGKAALLAAVKAGKGFVGSHCASDTFHTKGKRNENQDEKDPYIAMLGGEFIVHGAQQKTTMRVSKSDFPGMASAGEQFEMHEEWYALKNFAPDMQVLLVNETAGMTGKAYERPPFPATWARLHGKGRVFYTSMGHRADVWTNPIFQSILVGGIQWAIGDLKAKITPNIQQVTPKAATLGPN